MTRTFTCILCPNGCEIEATLDGGEIVSIQGHSCDKGRDYVTQEVLHPVRSIASSVLVCGGEIPLVSVRLTAPVPKERIFDVMGEIKKQQLVAPVRRGQVVIGNVLDLGSDVIATKSVATSSLLGPSHRESKHGKIWETKRGEMLLSRDVVQIRNPKTDRYVKIDRDAGRIVGQKKSPGPYKNIPVAPERKDK